MKSRFRSIALVATLAMGLAACGGSDGEAAPDPVTGAPPVVVTPEPQNAAFALTLATDKVVLMQGGSANVRATVTRSGGFNDAVTIELGGLPDGVSAAPAVVSAGADSVDLVLAAQGAAPHSLPTQATAQAQAAGQASSKTLTVTVRGLPGEVDTSFAGGTIITPVDIGEDYVNAVTVQADGKVLAAGSSATVKGTKLMLVRYGRDGGLDASFGNGGKVLTAVGANGNDSASAIAVQGDGKIVVAGSTDQGGTAGLDFALLRYNADGSLDTTFGNGGVVLTDFGSATDRAWALLLMPDGKIVAGGETNTGTTAGGVDFALARYTGGGALDASFGSAGKVVTALKSNAGTDIVRALAVQTVQGGTRILAAGGEGDFIAACYTDDGSVDVGFGNAGVTIKPMAAAGKNDLAHAMVLQADERITTVRAIVAGEANGSNHDVALTRLWL